VLTVEEFQIYAVSANGKAIKSEGKAIHVFSEDACGAKLHSYDGSFVIGEPLAEPGEPISVFVVDAIGRRFVVSALLKSLTVSLSGPAKAGFCSVGAPVPCLGVAMDDIPAYGLAEIRDGFVTREAIINAVADKIAEECPDIPIVIE